MSLVEEIRAAFATSQRGQALSLNKVSLEYPAWVLRFDGWYGVGIPYDNTNVVSEKFANAKLFTRHMVLGDENYNLLILASTEESLRMEFAAICAEYCEAGISGERRAKLINNPLNWWKSWRNLIGNAVRIKKVYSIISELLLLNHLKKKGFNPVWSGSNGGTHDIEIAGKDYEVKSTLNRYDETITISSQFQMNTHQKKLSIVLFRLEPSSNGISINRLVDTLFDNDANRDQVEASLSNMGLEIGTSARETSYNLLEIREYEVDEKFPLLTLESFKENKLPTNIKQITYTLSLENLEYKALDLEEFMPV